MRRFDFRDRDRSVFYIIDWPDAWRRFYFHSGLIHRDPLLEALKARRSPYTWTELRADRALSAIGTDALNRVAMAGWADGLVVPMSGGTNRAGLVSLVGHRAIDRPAREYLTLISLCLHTHVRMLAPREGFALPPAGMSDREIAVVRLVAKGATDGAIAAALGVARSTAHEFVEKAKAKLKVRNRAELIAIAVSMNIVDL